MANEDPTEPDANDATDATRREGPGSRKLAAREREAEERLPPGTRIARYVVRDVLGAGGMGVVYAAHDPELGRMVAIKLLQARHGVGSESGGQAWILREAQAMARLAHPNVVAVYDVGAMEGDRVFVAMELVEGMTLRAWLREPRPWREVLPVMRAAGAGLAAAHAAGLIHRDFKPDNVLVGNDGRVRVMDFGLARLHTDESQPTPGPIEAHSPLSERLTMTGALLGTPAYMAPELYRGGTANVLADQFAFGVALYEAVYHVRPYARAALVDQTATAPKPPSSPRIPVWLAHAVLRAVALEPEKRFRSMDELLAALDADPTAGRRRALIAVGGLVACSAAVAGALVLRNHGPEPCTDARAQLVGVWDAPRRAAVEAAFGKIDKPFAADAVHGTEKLLDGYATAWTTMHTDACRATRVHGSQSEDVLTLRMACLDTRRIELGALVEMFASADEQLVLGSVDAAQKLSSLAECADVAALRSPDPLPKDPAARERVTTMKSKVAEARAHYKAARLQDTLARLTALAPDVDKLEHLPTRAELHLLTGQTLWVMQGAEAGEPELRKAVLDAEAGKADEVKVEALLQLTNLANGAGKFEVATERLQEANAALARLGENWELHVRLVAAEALLELRQNHHAKAIEVAHRARDLAEKHADNQISYALIVEATILNAAAHAPEALADFKIALGYQNELGHRRIDVATTLQSMATAELQMGNIADAVPHLADALAIDESIYGPTNLVLINPLNALSAAQVMKGDLPAGLATVQRALDIVSKAQGDNDEQYAAVLDQLADTLIKLDRTKEAIEHLDHAQQIQTKKLGATNIQTLATMLTKCDAQRSAHLIPDALATCKSALAGAETAFGRDNALLFLFLVHTGMVLEDTHAAREAHALYERAFKIGAQDPSDILYLELLDADARWNLGEHPRAIELAKHARDGFAALGEAKAEQTTEAATWLEKHKR
jgi:tetratricopeptide (TPR) repeat protein